MDTNDDVQKVEAARAALQASGFPFQTAVAALVARTIGWSVADQEVPWLDSHGDSQFLDLVATNGHLHVSIECKKTQKETLTFLVPNRWGRLVRSAWVHCLHAEETRDSTRRMELFVEEWPLHPLSQESAFCVVSTSGSGKDQRLLERDSRLLVQGTDAYALERRRGFQRGPDPLPPNVLYIAAIVTNAPIFVAYYDPEAISLESGQFDPPPDRLVRTPWVRFRKSFVLEEGLDLGDRTVFVVRSASLEEFLRKLATKSKCTRNTFRRHLVPRHMR